MKFEICRDIFHSYNMKPHLQQLVFETRISLGPEHCATFVQDRLVIFLLSQWFIDYSLPIQQLPFHGVSYHCISEVHSVRDYLLNKHPWFPFKLSGACKFLSLLPCNLSAHIIRLPNTTNLNTHTWPSYRAHNVPERSERLACFTKTAGVSTASVMPCHPPCHHRVHSTATPAGTWGLSLARMGQDAGTWGHIDLDALIYPNLWTEKDRYHVRCAPADV
jgi:hypothetical protein